MNDENLRFGQQKWDDFYTKWFYKFKILELIFAHSIH